MLVIVRLSVLGPADFYCGAALCCSLGQFMNGVGIQPPQMQRITLHCTALHCTTEGVWEIRIGESEKKGSFSRGPTIGKKQFKSKGTYDIVYQVYMYGSVPKRLATK